MWASAPTMMFCIILVNNNVSFLWGAFWRGTVESVVFSTSGQEIIVNIAKRLTPILVNFPLSSWRKMWYVMHGRK
jgi:hypothetical protein